MTKIAEMVPERVGKELVELWEEYEKGETPEARAVKQLDKFDMIAQAHEYEQDHNRPGGLQEFFDSTTTAFTSEPFVAWAEQVRAARKK